MCREAKLRMFRQKHIREGRIDPVTFERIGQEATLDQKDSDDSSGGRSAAAVRGRLAGTQQTAGEAAQASVGPIVARNDGGRGRGPAASIA